MADNMAPKKLILFDLVSTITDAGPRYAEAYVRIAEAYNLPLPEKSDILDELGQRNLKDIIRIHSPDLPADKIQAFMSDCNNACDSMLYDVHWIEKLFSHVREGLSELKAQGYTLGLYTGTREDALQAQLQYHNLYAFFDPDLLRGKDNVRDHDKDTQSLKNEQIAAMIKVHASKLEAGEQQSVVVVGDTLSDFQAANQNNVRFVGFVSTAEKAENFTKSGVRALFSNYKDISSTLAAVFKQDQPAPKSRPAGPQA